MAVRGSIVIECDVKLCYAEIVIDARRLVWASLVSRLDDDGWKFDMVSGKHVCPQCAEEGKRA